MPGWDEMLLELDRRQEATSVDHIDVMRREYLRKLSSYTGRDTILYASGWIMSETKESSDAFSISDEDLTGFMEVVYGLKNEKMDLILYSPGGTAGATEAIVMYLREKFDDIRVIIPQAAMSAATMLACAANCLVMGKQSSLGPIDPQMVVHTQSEIKIVPAQAIIDEFEDAQEISKNEPTKLSAWIPLLNQYSPGILRQCHNAQVLSKNLVGEWLRKYMFDREPDAKSKADKIAETLSSYDVFKSHFRHIAKGQAREMGLKIVDLEDDQKLQDLVLSVFHAANITFQQTKIIKIIENHNGRMYAKLAEPDDAS